MNHTQNLHLPQWEKTDRLMMDDFNDAMASIDAGIKAANDAAAAPVLHELLDTINISGSHSSLTVNLPTIDWDKYAYVRLDTQLVGNDANVVVKPNGTSNASFSPFNGSGASAIGKIACTYPCSLFLLCSNDANRKLLALSVSSCGGIGHSIDIVFRNLTSLVLTPSSSSWPITGGTIKIYGVK